MLVRCSDVVRRAVSLILVFVFLHLPIVSAQEQANMQAGTSLSKNAPTYITIEKNIPNRGYLDSYHHIDDNISSLEKAAYMMRQLVTIDLLKSRRSLLELFNRGTAYQVQGWNVPKEVKDNFLYDQPNLPIKDLVKIIEEYKPKAGHETRRKVIAGLTKHAALITYLDHVIRHYDTHFWKHHKKIIELVADENQRLTEKGVKNSYHGFKFYHPEHAAGRNNVKAKYFKEMKVDEALTYIIALKANILKKYPILTSEIDEIPFYAHLYLNLRQEGFPNPDNYEDPNFQNIDEEVVLPQSFLEQFQVSWEKFSKKDWRKELYSGIWRKFDQTLINLLDSNTKALVDLNSTVHFNDNKTPFLILLNNERLWTRLKDNFTFFDISIINEAKEDATLLLEDEENRKKMRQMLLGGFAIALSLTGVGLFFAGVGGTIIAGSIFGLATTFALTNYALNYIDSSKLAELTENLFEATKDFTDAEEVENIKKINKEDYNTLILGAALSFLFVRGPIQSFFTKVTKGAIDKASRTVRISRVSFRNLKRRARIALGTNILSGNRQLMAIAQANKSLVNSRLSGVISKRLNKLGMSRDKAVAWVKTQPAFEKVNTFIKSYGVYIRDISIEVTALYLAERAIRGDKFDDEIMWFVANLCLSVGVVIAIIRRGTTNTRLMWPSAMRGNFKQAGLNYYHAGKSLALTIFKVSAPIYFGTELAMYFIEKQNYNECLNQFGEQFCEQRRFVDHMIRFVSNVVFASAFIGVSSTPRSEIVYKHVSSFFDRKFTQTFTKHGKLMSEMAKIPISAFNNWAGLVIRVYSVRALGLQGGDPEDVWISMEGNVNNAYYLFNELLLMEEEGLDLNFNPNKDEGEVEFIASAEVQKVDEELIADEVNSLKRKAKDAIKRIRELEQQRAAGTDDHLETAPVSDLTHDNSETEKPIKTTPQDDAA